MDAFYSKNNMFAVLGHWFAGSGYIGLANHENTESIPNIFRDCRVCWMAVFSGNFDG